MLLFMLLGAAGLALWATNYSDDHWPPDDRLVGIAAEGGLLLFFVCASLAVICLAVSIVAWILVLRGRR
jgi:hypothetical protein